MSNDIYCYQSMVVLYFQKSDIVTQSREMVYSCCNTKTEDVLFMCFGEPVREPVFTDPIMWMLY